MSGNKGVGGNPGQFVWVSALILLSAAIPMIAQLPTGAILGLVKDASGASIPNATVTAFNVGTDLTRTFMTGDEGA
jgi:hypothetical protein